MIIHSFIIDLSAYIYFLLYNFGIEALTRNLIDGLLLGHVERLGLWRLRLTQLLGLRAGPDTVVKLFTSFDDEKRAIYCALIVMWRGR
jgi:hypothetical protein